MPVVGPGPQLRPRQSSVQPVGVRRGYHPVLPALHEQNRRADRAEVEPPGRDESDVVVDQSVGSGLTRPLGVRATVS